MNEDKRSIETGITSSSQKSPSPKKAIFLYSSFTFVLTKMSKNLANFSHHFAHIADFYILLMFSNIRIC
jgi:hypothetical protein